ncbi:hypothetical protein C806_01327 [Lachnospiraceae bacterium 3-1]|nr:hypothetical protein C806_01327 [Lachnospiraceae bacterium 3-1]
MSTHKYFDKICCVILALTLVLTILFMNAESLGIQKASSDPGYEIRLFDTSKVHTVNIVMDDWDEFIKSCTDEEYAQCSVIIDNEAYKNVAIRAKGNTSLANVQNYGNDRYSFKIEFDHYDGTNTYYGLDKLNLNNIIQDNTYMKDYLSYQMMGYFGVSAPLCSYVQILVNGQEWGLYLAVEGVEESFLSRNYGNDYGELYKPDSMSMGGGRGNGGKMGGMDSSDVSLIYSGDEYSSYSNIFDNAKTDISDKDKDRFIASLKKLNENSSMEEVVNVEEVIRYFVVHNFVCNFDSYTGSMIHNYYLYEEEGQLSMIPWDYNLAFGGFVGGSDATSLVNYPIDTPVSGGTVESRPMLSWIFENEEYTELYHQYFTEFISQYFDSGYFEEMLDDVKTIISPYVESDPTKFCTYEEFEQGIDTLGEFCLLRAESVKAQLNGTIASTSDNQEKETFIAASDLSISDMGSMGDGQDGGMNRPDNNGQGEMPKMPQDGGMNRPDNNGQGEMPKMLQGNNGQGMIRPDDNSGQMGNQVSSRNRNSYIMLGICTAVLLTGLLFALIYKKRV